MADSFERLLGLPLRDALAELARAGVTNARVIATEAPPRSFDAPRDGVLAPDTDRQSTRVLAVRDGGRALVVARFRTGDPRTQEGSAACEA